jgi:hypothetical protein
LNLKWPGSITPNRNRGFFLHLNRGADAAEGNLHDVVGKYGENHTRAQDKYTLCDVMTAAKGSGDDKQFSESG